MRAVEGQLSGNRPIKRSREEKTRQLADLRTQLAGLKSHAAPALRESIAGKIKQLEADLGVKS